MKVLLLVVYLLSTVIAEDKPIVKTTFGLLHGKFLTSRYGKEFMAFLGIPYAAPPTGKLRLMPPNPPQKWEGVRNASQEGKPCVQRDVEGEENCLFLNVFTHSTKILNPVMVYIHGGGFYGGSSSTETYGPEYLLDKNIVLVTLQYRLGVFGFLSTEDSVVPGNMGLKDQRRALQWVQENISGFGGDATRVTIFGNSAGSASVHLHMLSSNSKDLFARAISQSGTATSAFSLIGKGTSKNITFKLINALKCPGSSSEDILTCLQSKSAKRIQKEYSKLQDSNNNDIRKVMFRPVVEEPTSHAFLTKSPLTETTTKPWLIGVNRNEGLFKINLKHLNDTIKLIKTNFQLFGPNIMFIEDTCSNPTEVARAVFNFYFAHKFLEHEIISSLEHLISDSWFLWPTIQSIERHNGSLYCYLFDHRGEHSFTEIRHGPKGYGVSHMDELQYFFSQRSIFNSVLNKKDETISKLMVDLWINFAESGNPTPYSISNNPQLKKVPSFVWEPSVSNNIRFLHIQTNKLSMMRKFFRKRMNFWRRLPIRDMMK